MSWPDRPDPAGTRLVLEAASSVVVSNRGKTYTFVIRKGLRFSDGSPVTARSFAYGTTAALVLVTWPASTCAGT